MAKLKKMTVHEIEDYILTSSPIFGMPSFKDILRIHVTGSYYKVFTRIIEDSLKELDRKRPLFLHSQIYIGSNGEYEFEDNLEAVTSGILDLKYLTLHPTSIINLGGSLLHAARTYTYDEGTGVLECSTLTGLVECDYLARHPFIHSKNPVEDEFTEDSVIYGLKMKSDYVSDMFINLVTYHLVCYIIELRAQVNYTELPIEIFSGLQDKKSDMDRIVEEFLLSPTQYYELWR